MSLRYQSLRRLASGGMAELFVVRAEDGVEYVAKRLLPQYQDDPTCIAMFEHEVALGMAMRADGVAHCQGMAEGDQGPAALFELIRGPSLEAIMEAVAAGNGRVKRARAVNVAGQAARAMAVVHAFADSDGPLEIVHRDLCPANILASEQGAVIIDFGVAVSRMRSDSGDVRGRLAYMAPEQARGETVDARADIYALGVIVFELITGRRFYGAGDRLAVLAALTDGRHPRISEFMPGESELSAIVERATAPELSQRTPSMNEFADQLADVYS